MRSEKVYKIESVPVKKNGTIKKVLNLYSEMGVPYKQLITDYAIVVSNRNIREALDPYTYYNKGILNNGMESGISKLQSVFNLGAISLSDEKPSDVIRAAFYNSSNRNDSSIEIGMIIPEFMEVSKNCRRSMIVNPSPDMILLFEKYRDKFENYYVVKDKYIAALYTHEFTGAHFITLDDIETCPMMDCMLIVNRDYLCSQTNMLFSWVKKCSGEIMAFIPNAFLENSVSWKEELIYSGHYISEILMIDNRSFNSRPRNKSLIRIEKNNDNQKKCCIYNSEYEPQMQFLTSFIDGRFISYNDLIAGEYTLKKLHNGIKQKQEKIHTYSSEKKWYKFSREISFLYKDYNDKNDRKRMVLSYNSITEIGKNYVKRGKRIGPYIERRGRTIDDICRRINVSIINSELCNYVRGDILKNLIDRFDGSISLKTLWLLCLNNLRMRKQYDEEIILKLLESYDGISDYDVYSYSNKQLSEMIAKRLGVSVDKIPLKYYEQLDLIFETAITLKYTNYNPVGVIISKVSKKATTRQQEVRDALVHKMLLADEEAKIFEFVVGKTTSSGKRCRCVLDSKYLLVLIRLFTGMALREVCALTWNDYKKINNSEEYHISVTKFIDDKGRVISHMDNEDISKYRWIPVAQPLKIILNMRKQFLNDKGIDDRDLDYMPIVMNKEEFSKLKNPKSMMMKSYDARNICKQALDELNFENDIVILPDEFNEITTDLYKYNGDIFVSNFWKKLNHLCGFENGEIDYILGRKSKVTFWKHYCDLTNDISQSIMAVKMNRWVSYYTAILEKHLDTAPVLSNWDKKSKIQTGPYNEACSYTEISINNNSMKAIDVELNIEVAHGYEYKVNTYGE